MVEVPSHTLELFASDPRVLSLIGTGAQGAARAAAVSPEALQRAERARRQRFAALDQQQQVGDAGRGGGGYGELAGRTGRLCGGTVQLMCNLAAPQTPDICSSKTFRLPSFIVSSAAPVLPHRPATARAGAAHGAARAA